MKKLLLLCAIFAVVGMSCVKKEFDLNQDLDLTVRLNVTFIPIGTTDSLFLRNFLDADSIDMLEIFNGGYAIVIDSTLSIEVPEISDFQGISIVINEKEKFDFGSFPTDIQFDVDSLYTEVDLGLYLPQSAVDFIITDVLPTSGGSIGLAELNALAPSIPVLSATGYFPLSLSAAWDTVVDFSVSEPLDNDYIVSVDTLWLQANSGFDVVVNPLNVPSGTMVRLDSLYLRFPTGVHLDMNASNSNVAVSRHTFIKRDINFTTGQSFRVPILYLTDIHKNGFVTFTGLVDFFAVYTLVGNYDGGPFPTTPQTSTRLDITVTPNLNFESATVTLDNNKIDAGLERVAHEFNINETLPNDITILSLDSIVFENTQIVLDLYADQLNGNIVDNLRVRMNIEFPKDIVFSPPMPGNVFDQYITFTNGHHKLQFDVRGMTLSNPIINNEINISDSIVVSASVSLKNPQINTKDFENIEVDLSVVGGMDINFSRIYANILFDNDISMDLSELPDILMNNRDSLVLDVNPHLDLRINTNLQIFDATIFLHSYKNGGVINTLDIPIYTTGTTENRFWIARDQSLMPQGQGYSWVEADLGAIVKEVPDSIVISIANSQVVFDFNINYSADLDYSFVVPLAFGEEFQIIIRDTMQIDSIVGKMISGNKIGLAIRTLNDMPLDLTATIIPIDENYSPLSNVEVSSFVIRAGATMNDEPAELIFDDKNNDQLVNMRGLILQLEARTGAGRTGQPLRPDNFIQVRLNAIVEDGITIDLRDFMD